MIPNPRCHCQECNEARIAQLRRKATGSWAMFWIALAALTLGLSALARAQATSADADGAVKWVRPASELTTPYTAPAQYDSLWRAVGTRCLGLTRVPALDWSFYSVDADAFTTIWSGSQLVVAYTAPSKHSIWMTKNRVAKPGTVAHEMLHAMLADLGREWGANHPGQGRNLPMAGADSVFARCGLWPIPESYP